MTCRSAGPSSIVVRTIFYGYGPASDPTDQQAVLSSAREIANAFNPRDLLGDFALVFQEGFTLLQFDYDRDIMTWGMWIAVLNCWDMFLRRYQSIDLQFRAQLNFAIPLGSGSMLEG